MESAFAYSSLKSFIPKFQNQSEILVRRLEKEVGGSYFSLLPYMKECGFDIIVGKYILCPSGTVSAAPSDCNLKIYFQM